VGQTLAFGGLPVARQTTKTDRLPHVGEKIVAAQRNQDLVVQAFRPGIPACVVWACGAFRSNDSELDQTERYLRLAIQIGTDSTNVS